MSTTTLPTTSSASRVRSQGAALAVILGSALMIALDASVMTVAMPKIKDELGFSPTNLSWIQNAYTLSFGSLLLLGGRAGDMFGRRRMFMLGVAVFTVASALGGLAGGAAMLLAARAL